MTLSENVAMLFKLGFTSSPDRLAYIHGPVEVTFEEARKYDNPYLKHLIDARAHSAKYDVYSTPLGKKRPHAPPTRH